MTRAHFLVTKTARELAGADYESMMAIDAFAAQWKAQNPTLHGDALARKWIARAWPAMIPTARSTLAQMLATPIAQVLKDQIEDALIKDNVFQEARKLQWQRTNQGLIRELTRRQRQARVR